MFLLMIFLDFIFEERDINWLRWIERPLAKLGKVDMLSVCIALIVLLIAAMTFATHAHQHGGAHADKAETVLLAGIAGLITYLIVGGLSGYFEDKLEEEEEREHEAEEEAKRTGKQTSGRRPGRQGRVLHVPLPRGPGRVLLLRRCHRRLRHHQRHLLMALGLGIGAMYVRSLTVYLVRQGTLDDYVYLEHGAHYAIGALAVHPARHHPVPDQRGHHRPGRRRPDRLVLLVLGAPQQGARGGRGTGDGLGRRRPEVSSGV